MSMMDLRLGAGGRLDHRLIFTLSMDGYRTEGTYDT